MVQLELEGICSSYSDNSFGSIFYSLVRITRPGIAVELGTYMGYSALHIAAALRDNMSSASLYMVDLWDEYPYTHCSLDLTRSHFERNGLLNDSSVDLHFINSDAYAAVDRFERETLDFLHVDLSNDGNSLSTCMDLWYDRLKPGATTVFEGGSEERDRHDWMVQYSKTPIASFLTSDWYRDRFESITLQPFPSLTIARKLP